MVTARRKQILIVEDEEALARMIGWQLEAAGYEVELATNGTAALQYASAYRPDVVILDLRLPDIHGYEVCQQLRKLYHPWVVPILMLTALNQPIDQLRGFAHGADAYLTKPCEMSELLKTINLLLGEAVPT